MSISQEINAAKTVDEIAVTFRRVFSKEQDERSVYQIIDEVIDAADMEEPMVAQWDNTKDIGNGMEIPVRHGVRLFITVDRGRLSISGKGFKSYYRKIKNQMESLRTEFESALGIESASSNMRTREVDETDGGFQEYRY